MEVPDGQRPCTIKEEEELREVIRYYKTIPTLLFQNSVPDVNSYRVSYRLPDTIDNRTSIPNCASFELKSMGAKPPECGLVV